MPRTGVGRLASGPAASWRTRPIPPEKAAATHDDAALRTRFPNVSTSREIARTEGPEAVDPPVSSERYKKRNTVERAINRLKAPRRRHPL